MRHDLIRSLGLPRPLYTKLSREASGIVGERRGTLGQRLTKTVVQISCYSDAEKTLLRCNWSNPPPCGFNPSILPFFVGNEVVTSDTLAPLLRTTIVRSTKVPFSSHLCLTTVFTVLVEGLMPQQMLR